MVLPSGEKGEPMCDDRTVHEDDEFLRSAGALSRRSFGAMSMAALGACATGPSDSGALVEQDVSIATPDGAADAYFVHPAAGAHPGVLVWPDIVGLRPAFRTMGKRLAQSGYAVLVVNPFYRLARAPVLPEGASFADPGHRETLMGYARTLTPETQVADATAFVAFLDGQRAVDKQRKIGTTGYCMGGPITMRTAAALPERIGAGASFHGGRLATDQPDSPHLLVPQMRARFLFAIAQNDDQADPAAKTTLRDAFAAANLQAEIEVYPAQHGWCAIDSRVYDEVQAERAWSRLLALFETGLG
jgi:carboxymethylenebutenolidase